MPAAEYVLPVRLNKYISYAGLCARRTADLLIQSGQITVNDQKITELGHRVQAADVVKYQGQVLQAEQAAYIVLNKPKDCITALYDPQGRRTVVDCIRRASTCRIYPVGRLDRYTTGLLLLTNDGALAQRLAHPSFQIQKTYAVCLDRPMAASDGKALTAGVVLEDGVCHVDNVSLSGKTVRVDLHMGKYRIIRRLFQQLGYQVVRLDRVGYGGLTLKNLPRGTWRRLMPAEVRQLKQMTSVKISR